MAMKKKVQAVIGRPVMRLYDLTKKRIRVDLDWSEGFVVKV